MYYPRGGMRLANGSSSSSRRGGSLLPDAVVVDVTGEGETAASRNLPPPSTAHRPPGTSQPGNG